MKFKDFKVRRLTFAFLQAISVTVLLLFVSTAAVAQEVSQDSLAHIIQKHKLPLTTRIAVEGMYSLILINTEKLFAQSEDSSRTTLWIYKEKNKQLSKILTTVGLDSPYWQIVDGKKALKFNKDSIPNIYNVLMNTEESKIMVEGGDDRNSFSYIIDLDNFHTIQLPCNAGVMGLTSEEELLVCQSYRYLKKGGRYNVISIFDWNGRCLLQNRIPLMR